MQGPVQKKGNSSSMPARPSQAEDMKSRNRKQSTASTMRGNGTTHAWQTRHQTEDMYGTKEKKQHVF